MLIRPPINAQPARTVQDMSRDPFDWLDGPHRRRGIVGGLLDRLRDLITGPPPAARDAAYAAVGADAWPGPTPDPLFDRPADHWPATAPVDGDEYQREAIATAQSERASAQVYEFPSTAQARPVNAPNY